MSQSPSQFDDSSVHGMVFSNVIVDVPIPRRSFVFAQSRAEVSPGFTNLSSLLHPSVSDTPLETCTVSGILGHIPFCLLNNSTNLHKQKFGASEKSVLQSE